MWRAAGLVALLGLGAAAVTAQPASVRAYLAWFDRNGDQLVDRQEYVAYMMRGFTAMDDNGNGVLEAREVPPSRHPRTPVSRGEHRHSLVATFKRQDLDGDGFLSATEMAEPPH